MESIGYHSAFSLVVYRVLVKLKQYVDAAIMLTWTPWPFSIEELLSDARLSVWFRAIDYEVLSAVRFRESETLYAIIFLLCSRPALLLTPTVDNLATRENEHPVRIPTFLCRLTRTFHLHVSIRGVVLLWTSSLHTYETRIHLFYYEAFPRLDGLQLSDALVYYF